MTRQVYTVGSDSPDQTLFEPSKGPGGAFAREITGFTPKYALNQGPREVQQKNTMARMFVQVPPDELKLFKASITDSNLRNFILPTLVTKQNDVTLVSTGYMDFFLQQIQSSFQEKYQVVETLSDNYVAYFFGQSAPIWQYSGELLNTVQDDQLSAWVRMYVAILRGTQLARRNKTVSLRYDNFIVTGTMFNTSWAHSAQNELRIPFSFSFLVKRVYVVGFTAGWRPTQINNDALTDPNLTSGTAPVTTQASVLQASGATSDSSVVAPQGQTTGLSNTVYNASDPDVAALNSGALSNNSFSLNDPDVAAVNAAALNQNDPRFGLTNTISTVHNPAVSMANSTSPFTLAQQQVTGQPAEAQTVTNAATLNDSVRPQDNPQQQVNNTNTEISATTVGNLPNGSQAPRNLQSLTL